MITLPIIDINPPEILSALASLAPADTQNESPTTPDISSKKSRSRDIQTADLGEFDLEKYLSHYGIEYDIKIDTTGTIYRLARCLFNPDHTKNEASIIQGADKKIRYQCFHNACKSARRSWRQARQLISGAASLKPFMSGYDPNYVSPPDEPGTGILRDVKIEPVSSFSLCPPGVPLPQEIDPMEFFGKTKDGKLGFLPERMVQYYVRYFKHIIHTAGVFWIFKAGVWQEISEFVINQVCVLAMKEYIQPTMIDGTLKVLRGLINKEPKEWPEPSGYINCRDGMIDIFNGMKLIPHDPELGSRSQIPCDFDVKYLNECTRWYQFLDEVFPKEPDKIDLLQEFFGYCLWSDCRFEKMLFLIGSGGNGKGTVIDALTEMIGPENISSLTMRDLSDPKFSLYFLQNKLVNVATETSHRDPVATEHLKTIVSGEWLTGERKHGHKFQFKPYAKMVLAMNDIPVIPDRSYGVERRLLLLKFNQRFTDATKDPDLKKKIRSEKNGIFAWSLLGLERLLHNNGFGVSGTVRADQVDFLKALHPLLQFVEERCELGPSLAVEVLELYKEYTQWCRDGNYRAMARNRFCDHLLMNYPAVEKRPYGPNRRMHFIGLEITQPGLISDN